VKRIELTDAEIRISVTVATDRIISSLRKGHKQKHGYDGGNLWEVNVNGAAAELAYAKFRKEYFSASVDTYKDADHGEVTQIRWTKHTRGKLIIREDDNPEHYYVLVVSPLPKMYISGFIKGSEVEDKYKTNFGIEGRPLVWAIPQDKLRRF